MKVLSRIVLKILKYFKIYPQVFFIFNPFKIYEFKELTRELNFSKDEIILDIGCGDGLQTILIGKRCKKIIGIDISEKSIEKAKYLSLHTKERINSEFHCVKIENAEFENEYFDKVFSICVIEHIPNYVDILKEAYRILKKDGQMIFSVDSLDTIEDELLEKHRKKYFVEKYFKKDELKIILEDVGFIKVDIFPIFKSNFAKKLFIKGINNTFQYNIIYQILIYIFLIYSENQCIDEKKGIFLIVKCSK